MAYWGHTEGKPIELAPTAQEAVTMNIKILATVASASLAAVLLASAFSRSDTTEAPTDPAATEVTAEAVPDPTGTAAEVATSSVLSQIDADGLAFIREEEKLAGDVYTAMYEQWGLPIFANIADAESTHTSAVVDLLDSYQLLDPADGLAAGEFTNPDLQALYDELVETGSQSVIDALEVGALIEELDITDLRLRESDQPDIDLVYSNLERGSNNHLRAFNRQLERRDVTYVPTYLDQETFDQITSTPTQRGGHGG